MGVWAFRYVMRVHTYGECADLVFLQNAEACYNDCLYSWAFWDLGGTL